jgi:nitroreductase
VETWDAIRSRRDVREFESRPIADDDLDRVLEAGRRAPSSQNWQPWAFVVVTDRERLGELATVWRGAAHVAHSAATIAVVAPRVEDERKRQIEYFDLGQAVVTMMIAAADLGIGSGHSAVGDEERAREILGYPDDHFCAHLVPLGYPAGRPLVPMRRPDRRPFSDVVHRERW